MFINNMSQVFEIEKLNKDLDTYLHMINAHPTEDCVSLGKAVDILDEISKLVNTKDRAALFSMKEPIKYSITLSEILMGVINSKQSWTPFCGSEFNDASVSKAAQNFFTLKSQAKLSIRNPVKKTKNERKKDRDGDSVFSNGEFEQIQKNRKIEKDRKEHEVESNNLQEFKLKMQRIKEEEEEANKPVPVPAKKGFLSGLF